MPEPATGDKYFGTVDLRIPGKPEWVAVARLTIAAIANRLPFTVEEIEDLKLAIAEACTNAIQAGGGNGEPIDIRCETAADHLRIVVRDRGTKKPEPVPAGKATPVEGLGVFLIQALMDGVEHSFDAARGSELIMTKRVGS
ncbi:MAG: ATP-binding protein [Candidatus Eremiobacteraeota bacterium]|nr:ATP-binding protein [Candidatus Eremiobacteraeota bacterium]